MKNGVDIFITFVIEIINMTTLLYTLQNGIDIRRQIYDKKGRERSTTNSRIYNELHEERGNIIYFYSTNGEE